MTYREVQQIARDTIAYARKSIRPGMRLCDVRSMCEEKMMALGADSFWYWDVGAFVFSGDEQGKFLAPLVHFDEGDCPRNRHNSVNILA